jgi:hypothetical protein
MSRRRSDSNDTLRPHYELDELEPVAFGAGWARRKSTKVAAGTNLSERYYASRLALARPLFSSKQIDRDLVTDFFITFARAEYALKKAGYISEQKSPKILWGKFAQELDDRLIASDEPAVQQAVKYLIANPPSKQVVKNKKLTWEPLKSDTADTLFLIRSITIVRNNLFHGGKEIHRSLEERDFRLLLSCLNLLTHALTINRNVLRYFREDVA